MHDRRKTLHEWMLGCLLDKDAASAILGDLAEVSATRGRLWYWTAYVRTLLTLGWHASKAFIVAAISFVIFYRLWVLLNHSLLRFHIYRSLFFMPPALHFSVLQLWFIAPFAAMKFGWRDRFAKVSFVVALLATLMCIQTPEIPVWSLGTGVFCLTLLVASPHWRKPTLALGATTGIGALLLANLFYLAHLGSWVYAHKTLDAKSHYRYFDAGFALPHYLFWSVMWTIILTDMLITSLTCSRTNRWLLEQQSSGKRTIA